MSNLSNKIVQILLWVLMGITVVLAVIFYAGDVVEGTQGNLEEPVITETFIHWAYLLMGLAAGLTVIFSVLNLVLNPQGAKKALVAILGTGVVVFVAWLLADDTVLNLPHYTGDDNVPSTLKMVDTGLFTTYLLAGLAVVAIIYSEISRAIR